MVALLVRCQTVTEKDVNLARTLKTQTGLHSERRWLNFEPGQELLEVALGQEFFAQRIPIHPNNTQSHIRRREQTQSSPDHSQASKKCGKYLDKHQHLHNKYVM